MSWWGDVEDELQTAARRIDKCQRGTLEWFVAANEWNTWALEATSDENRDGWVFEDHMVPHNCEFEVCTEEDEPPQIEIPEYDMTQSLLLKKKDA